MICNALAKAFVLSIKGHTGFSCTECTIKGTHVNRRVYFPSTTLPCHLRTDELFAANTYKNFQTGYSILNNIPNFLPISHTPLDYMHLLCLGVVKKIILLWIKEGSFSVRISSRLINQISHLLTSLKSSTPKDFVRKPRSLRDVKLWKAVEFRNFLLYTGLVVLKHVLKKDIYNHFITLHMAVTILVSPSLCQDRLVNYAEALLNNFVKSFEILYGKQYISHNIHNLLRICSDVRIFGPLDNYSCSGMSEYPWGSPWRLKCRAIEFNVTCRSPGLRITHFFASEASRIADPFPSYMYILYAVRVTQRNCAVYRLGSVAHPHLRVRLPTHPSGSVRLPALEYLHAPEWSIIRIPRYISNPSSYFSNSGTPIIGKILENIGPAIFSCIRLI